MMQTGDLHEELQGDSPRDHNRYGEVHVVENGVAHLGDVITHNYFQPGRSDEERERGYYKALSSA